MYKRSFVLFLSYFNRNRDYFECHEVLEEHWKEVAPGVRDHELVGFIQLATGMYHWRRGNYRGAQTILAKASRHLRLHPTSSYYTGIDMATLLAQLTHIEHQVQQQAPFKPFAISIVDAKLQAQVTAAPLPDLSEDFIRDKHKLRNRDDVILQRAKRLAAKHPH